MWPSPRPVEEWSILDHVDLWVSSWMVLLGLMVAGGLAGLASGGAGGAQATALLRIGEVYKPAEETRANRDSGGFPPIFGSPGSGPPRPAWIEPRCGPGDGGSGQPSAPSPRS
jgi:hypothetical protein